MDIFRRGGTKPNLSRFTDAPAATAFSDPKPSAQSPIDAADPPAVFDRSRWCRIYSLGKGSLLERL